jgi:hypothetical protein
MVEDSLCIDLLHSSYFLPEKTATSLKSLPISCARAREASQDLTCGNHSDILVQEKAFTTFLDRAFFKGVFGVVDPPNLEKLLHSLEDQGVRAVGV